MVWDEPKGIPIRTLLMLLHFMHFELDVMQKRLFKSNVVVLQSKAPFV